MKHEITYYPNGNKKSEYYYNDLGQYHNEVGAGAIFYHENGNKEYEHFCIGGLYHNIKGPSYIRYDVNGNVLCKEYYLNDKIIDVNSDEEFKKYIKRLNVS